MITIDLELYYVCVGAIVVALCAAWGFRRVKAILSGR